ncbi:MAG: peptidylprolyl isomerase [Bacteroidetes bacterium]|jgi:FKBP-type peptidyl-prolyl cis-trans isomerase SlyD|nr:peptidylprolyl isomerase [Bacteroidota bacterium]
MTIDKNKVVSVNYHLSSKFENDPEELVEQTSVERPFVFLYGSGGIIPTFENELKGKKAGDKFDFRVAAAEGYGMYNEEYVAEIPKEAFLIEGKFDEDQISLGKEVPMMDAEGNQMYGIVLEVADTYVAMDFNHPLAGHDLHFVGEVLEVRDASAEEISHGHVHGEHGHHH